MRALNIVLPVAQVMNGVFTGLTVTLLIITWANYAGADNALKRTLAVDLHNMYSGGQ